MTMYNPAPAFAATSGPRDAKIVLVGEAWGENEETLRSPFVGWSGYELSKMCFEAGLCAEAPLDPRAYSNMMLADWWGRQQLLLTNVFAFRPRENKLESICGKKAEVGSGYWRQPLGKGGYILPEYLGELERLKEELCQYERHCIIALGATATWALMNQPKISAVRGVATSSLSMFKSLKILPTYHPAGILRNWSWRSIAVADLGKVARREGKFPEVQRPMRSVLINPTIHDIEEFFKTPALAYAVDTETFRGQVSMVGFASSPARAIVIPLIDRQRPGWSYWSPQDEAYVHRLICRVMAGPSLKIGQNFLYDLQYFFRALRMRPRNVAEDTMLLSHSLMPEMQKSLGFLGSILTNEASWKLFRSRGQEELKREE